MQASTWEHPLLVRANEALNTPALDTHLVADDRAYKQAYAYCDQIVKANSHTFYAAGRMLPSDKRRAVHALYAFCRATDDLIDTMSPSSDEASDGQRLLENWQSRLVHTPTVYDPVPLAWADTQARYQIPHGYAVQLIEGIARDLRQHRYQTFAELADYCYGVASTVGLMVMHIIDYQSEAALLFAVKLGIALQLTNILRDVGVDWRSGRLYLPLDELAQFGLTEAEIARGCVDERWRAFMQYQINRARALYSEAEPGIALLDPEGRFAIAAAAGLYRAILEDIEAHDYDVFHHRAHIGNWGKIKRLPRIWWATRRLAKLPATSGRMVRPRLTRLTPGGM